MAKVVFFRGKDLLRIARSFQFTDKEDFFFATLASFFFQAKISLFFSIEYVDLFRDPTIVQRPGYYYGLRGMLSGQTPAIKKWKQKYPEELEMLWRWNDAAAFEDIISDTKKMLDIFSAIKL